MRAFLAVVLAWLGFAGSALAENRLALVIGNDSYQHIDALRKARADAKSYADLLREKGFSVEDRYDLGFVDMQAAVGEFVDKIEPGDTAVFVYSGHGWSDGAHNYLVGVDVPNRASQERLTRLSLPIRNGAAGVLDDFERKGAALKVAIIDACRDNPFQPPPGQRGYGLSRGLRPEGVEGSFVVYSAGEGQSAMDRLSDADADPNSLFTRAFLPLLRADMPLLDAIKLSQERVYALARTTDHDQTPAYYDEVRGRACLSQGCKAAHAVPASSESDDALAAIIDAQTNPDVLEGMIAKLPEGFLKERAKKKSAGLRESQVANIPLPPPVPERSSSDDAFATFIDAQTSPDTLAETIAKLSEGPLKERAQKELMALRESQVANLPALPPIPAPAATDVANLPVPPPIPAPAASDVAQTSPDGRYLTIVNGMIMARVHKSTSPHLKSKSEGTISEGTIAFTIDERGYLTKRRTTQPSGSPELDAAIYVAIGDASPFPPPPSGRPSSLKFAYRQD